MQKFIYTHLHKHACGDRCLLSTCKYKCVCVCVCVCVCARVRARACELQVAIFNIFVLEFFQTSNGHFGVPSLFLHNYVLDFCLEVDNNKKSDITLSLRTWCSYSNTRVDVYGCIYM